MTGFFHAERRALPGARTLYSYSSVTGRLAATRAAAFQARARASYEQQVFNSH